MHVVGKAFHILVSGIIVYDEILERYGFASDKRIHESCHFLRVVTFPEIIEKFPPFHLLIIFRGKSRLNRVFHAENIFMDYRHYLHGVEIVFEIFRELFGKALQIRSVTLLEFIGISHRRYSLSVNDMP